METIKTFRFVSSVSRLEEAIENRLKDLRAEYKIKSASLSATRFPDEYLLCLVLEENK